MAALGAALLGAGCGSSSDASELGATQRPPTLVEIGGSISTDRGVQISPTHEGGGPMRLTLSNQAGRTLTVTIEGSNVLERSSPIEAGGTGSIVRTLEPGRYEIRAGSRYAMDVPLPPAVLVIGPQRPSSNTELLLP